MARREGQRGGIQNKFEIESESEGEGEGEGAGIAQVAPASYGVNPDRSPPMRCKAHSAPCARRGAPRCGAYAVKMIHDPDAPLPAAAMPFETQPALSMEASGTGPGSFPIEIGFVLPDGASYCTLIRPLPHWIHWDADAERRHRIARETAEKHGREVAEVAGHLNARLAGRTLYCDGAADARSWLQMLFDAAATTPEFAIEDLRALLSEREAAFWHVLRQQVATEMRLQRHRASADAKILQATLARMRGPLGTGR